MDTARRFLSQYRYGAIALVTVLTVVIVGAVVLTTTSAGCGPANRLGLKTARCVNTTAAANFGQASPSPSQTSQPTSQPTVFPGPSTPPAQPTVPAASSTPPYNVPASSYDPSQGPASSSYPPLAFPGSGVPYSVALSCRLPVFAGGPGSGGFIVLPGQTFVADPRSAVIAPLPSPASSPSPTYGGPGYPSGWWGLTYDAAYSKWAPVPYLWVSPDGVHYAYPATGDIYVQNVANGTQLELGQGHGFSVLRVENNGVYVTL